MKKIGIKSAVAIGLAGLLAALVVIGVWETNRYESSLKDYASYQQNQYEQTTNLYKSKSDQLVRGIVKLTDQDKYPSLEDKMNAQAKLFGTQKRNIAAIVKADKVFVSQLSDNVPEITSFPPSALVYPPYSRSLEKPAQLQQILKLADRHIKAEVFMAQKARKYFLAIAKLQESQQAKAIYELAEVFTSALPGRNEREAKLKRIRINKYTDISKYIIPDTAKIVKSIPMPNDPYYETKRQEALDMLERSKTMYDLYLKAEKTGDKATMQKADAMANKNKELKDFVNRAAGIMLSAFQDISGLESDMKKLGELVE